MTHTVDRERVFGETAGSPERIAPGYFSEELESEHVERYRWASRWAPGRTVLDIASGTGYGSRMLRDRGARTVVSADVSAQALRFARLEYGAIAVEADGRRLPFDAVTFDLVVALETIEHLPEADRFAAELARVLRPGGLLLLSTPEAGRSDGRNPYHLREFELRELRELLQGAGFSVSGVWGQHWSLPLGRLAGIKGFRRLSWVYERRTAVRRSRLPGSLPLYWCLAAERTAP